MSEMILSSAIVQHIENLYADMETAYDTVAEELDFSCQGCPDNCCDSYFVHHTYLEWSYLWHGIRQLPKHRQEKLLERARQYVQQAEQAIQQKERPQIMCPLNENGLCVVYKHRLMVCRTHGVPAKMTRPDGQVLHFPGCFRCQEMQKGNSTNTVERTPLLHQLAKMENDLLNNKRHIYPKVKLTIAEMLVKGPPTLPATFCQRGESCDG